MIFWWGEGMLCVDFFPIIIISVPGHYTLPDPIFISAPSPLIMHENTKWTSGLQQGKQIGLLKRLLSLATHKNATINSSTMTHYWGVGECGGTNTINMNTFLKKNKKTKRFYRGSTCMFSFMITMMMSNTDLFVGPCLDIFTVTETDHLFESMLHNL